MKLERKLIFFNEIKQYINTLKIYLKLKFIKNNTKNLEI